MIQVENNSKDSAGNYIHLKIDPEKRGRGAKTLNFCQLEF